MFRAATAHGGRFALEVAQCASLRYQRCVPLLWAWLLKSCITIGCYVSRMEYRCFLSLTSFLIIMLVVVNGEFVHFEMYACVAPACSV